MLVTADDFIRAESDAVFTGLVAQRGFGNSYHDRELTRIANHTVQLNNITAKKADDGSVSTRFGECDGGTSNCRLIMPGWNYGVRLPRAEAVNGKWKFPEATLIN